MNEKTGIILLGASGRMGRAITGVIGQGSDCVLACAVERPECLESIRHLPCPVTDNIGTAIAEAPHAVIVDFTGPDSSIRTAEMAAGTKTPAVIGSTGFNEDQKRKLGELAKATPILWSANMSIGINVLEEILPRLTKMLGPDYDVEIMEIHHKHKKDAPSGTALMLGEAIADAKGHELSELRRDCRSGIIGERKAGEIGIQAIRGGEVPGVHTVWFFGPSESIEITHRADSRENFARGALRAASWLKERPAGKLYSMRDVLAIRD